MLNYYEIVNTKNNNLIIVRRALHDKNTINNNKSNKKNLEYNIIGDAFLGSLFNMSGDLDNSSQNLMMSIESDKIQEAMKITNKKEIQSRK